MASATAKRDRAGINLSLPRYPRRLPKRATHPALFPSGNPERRTRETFIAIVTRERRAMDARYRDFHIQFASAAAIPLVHRRARMFSWIGHFCVFHGELAPARRRTAPVKRAVSVNKELTKDQQFREQRTPLRNRGAVRRPGASVDRRIFGGVAEFPKKIASTRHGKFDS